MTRLSVRVKLPKRLFDIPSGKAQIKKSLDDLAAEAKGMFGETTATWKNKPAINVESVGNKRIIRIEGKIYGYVDKGTPPHPIYPRRARVLSFRGGYKAKTRPGVIGASGGGASGARVFAKVVRHPGNAPRNFSVVIRERIEKRLEAEAVKILKAYKVK